MDAGGGFGGGFFAIWVPSPFDLDNRIEAMDHGHYDLALPKPIEQRDALEVVMAEAAILQRLEDLGAVRICTTNRQKTPA